MTEVGGHAQAATAAKTAAVEAPQSVVSASSQQTTVISRPLLLPSRNASIHAWPHVERPCCRRSTSSSPAHLSAVHGAVRLQDGPAAAAAGAHVWPALLTTWPDEACALWQCWAVAHVLQQGLQVIILVTLALWGGGCGCARRQQSSKEIKLLLALQSSVWTDTEQHASGTPTPPRHISQCVASEASTLPP